MNAQPHQLKLPWRLRESFLPLLLALIFVLVAAPLASETSLFPSLFNSALLLSGVFAVIRSRTALLFVVVGLLICLALRWLTYFVGERSTFWVVLTELTFAVYLILLFMLVVARVLAHQEVTRNTVVGAVCGYLLIAYVFGAVFAALLKLAPDALAMGPMSATGVNVGRFAQDAWALTYFSFTTLTTLGYGDIVPVSPLARSLAALEVLTGQLYLVAFMAWLVGAAAARARTKQNKAANSNPITDTHEPPT